MLQAGFSFSSFSFTSADLTALIQVVLADLALAADNAVVVALAVAGLPDARQRRLGLLLGTGLAALLRAAGGLVALRLLALLGLTLAGGLLLLWVSWKMYRELRGETEEPPPHRPARSLPRALLAIAAADFSMSLDNVLAVAGAADERPLILVLGLALGVALTAFASHLLNRLFTRFRALAWLGWASVLVIALEMIARGGLDVWQAARRG
jgi:YjbE family integral membrane protein